MIASGPVDEPDEGPASGHASNAIRERGWLVPAYTFPKNRTDLAVLRVVVRRGFSHDMADLLVGDLERQLPRLRSQSAPLHDGLGATGFHH